MISTQLISLNMKQSELPGGFLNPVTSARFFDDYWEIAPLHVGRSDDHYFSDLLSLTDIETALSCQEFSFPAVQLTHAGQSVPVSDYTDQNNQIVVQRLLERHQQGATIVVSAAQKYFPGLGALTRQVQTDLQLRAQTNVYLSPPGRQGFNAHFDNHDVFILQVSGKKTFRFYSGGTELPFSENSFDPDHDEAGAFEEEIGLEAGDTLYIPRGIIHDAVADDKEPSLHITLGVYAITVRHLLQEILQRASEKDVRYRKSIDNKLWQQTSVDHAFIVEQAQQLMSAAFSADNFNDAITRLRDDIALDTTPDCDGWLSASQSLEIQPDSVLTVRGCQILSKDVDADSVTLRVAGRVIKFDPAMATAINYLLQQGQSSVADLQGLAVDQQIALANRLYQEHIVDVVSATS